MLLRQWTNVEMQYLFVPGVNPVEKRIPGDTCMRSVPGTSVQEIVVYQGVIILHIVGKCVYVVIVTLNEQKKGV